MYGYLQKHPTTAAIFVFLILFVALYFTKPKCFFQSDGSMRPFGIGYKNKTILPIWLFSILLGIFCYFSMLYIIQHRTFF